MEESQPSSDKRDQTSHRHEAAAAFMADAYARVARRPGVCMSTLGPGATDVGPVPFRAAGTARS